MDITTLIGLVIGIAVVLAAILVESSVLVFLNLPGLLIVLGGTFAKPGRFETFKTYSPGCVAAT